MTSSLVGSEMCIRDSCNRCFSPLIRHPTTGLFLDTDRQDVAVSLRLSPTCLLYTSDAADDM
eukprot:5368665-Prorocentrum_lima.AAC.1